MDLWVRSQDKKILTKVKDIKLDKYIGDKENILIVSDFYELGKYKAEERALEILDEIQNILSPELKIINSKIKQCELLDCSSLEHFIQPILEDTKILQFNTYVYQMPEE